MLGRYGSSTSTRISVIYNIVVSSTIRRPNIRKLSTTTPFETQDPTTPSKSSQGHSGPIPLNTTPRGAAAAKIGTRNGVINGTKDVNGINGGRNHNHGQSPNGSTSTNFYMHGDMPCDPQPPPFQLANYGEESLYTLVLLRHGESEWNAQNRYTGWCDVNLTPTGEMEARAAGRLLYENGIEIDHAFTSLLKRASFSCNMALNTAQQHWVPVTKTWRLNERHYGALQGYNKDTAYEDLNLDQELVMQMRRSYDVRPPRMDDNHKYWHGHDRRYDW